MTDADGAVCADKGYVGALREALRRGDHPMVIKRIVKNQGVELLYPIEYNFRRLLAPNPA